MTNLSNARGTIAENASLDDLIFHDTDAFTLVNDLIAVNGMDVASNLSKDQLLLFTFAHILVNDPMYANMMPVANLSVMYALHFLLLYIKERIPTKSLYSHHHLLVIDVHILEKDLMYATVASLLLEKRPCLDTKDVMMQGKAAYTCMCNQS